MKEIKEFLGVETVLDMNLVADVLTQIKQSPEAMTFIEQHTFSDAQIITHANTFLEYIKYVNATPLVQDDQKEGYLYVNDYQQIEFGYRYTARYQKLVKLKEYITCLYMDTHMLQASIKDFSSQLTSSAGKASIQMIRKLQQGELPQKGLYIAGENGVGKTHLLFALAKEFATQKIKVTVVFVPEIIRTIKQNPYQADAIIRQLQKATLLMLDDIGSEMQTSESRDEILLPILNARMNNQLLTFFSSNFAFADLEQHFAQTQYNEFEPVKAKRIIERIKTLSDFVTITGENYRK